MFVFFCLFQARVKEWCQMFHQLCIQWMREKNRKSKHPADTDFGKCLAEKWITLDPPLSRKEREECETWWNEIFPKMPLMDKTKLMQLFGMVCSFCQEINVLLVCCFVLQTLRTVEDNEEMKDDSDDDSWEKSHFPHFKKLMKQLRHKVRKYKTTYKVCFTVEENDHCVWFV